MLPLVVAVTSKRKYWYVPGFCTAYTSEVAVRPLGSASPLFSLALRLSQFDYAFAYNKRKPILLLDDIFDKLDRLRITELLNMVGNEHFGQVFISDTDETRVRSILGEHGIEHQIFEIKKHT